MVSPIIQLTYAGYAPILYPTKLSITPGEKVAIIGESGSGKTTLIRLLCGWLTPTEGEIIAPPTGEFAFIPQDLDASLNPALTVRDIICEPVAIARGNMKAARERVPQLLTELGLDPSFAPRRPHELSGGQRQRVGIARALITNPRVIYADESLSALDRDTRSLVMRLLSAESMTTLLITHDLHVAHTIAERILVVAAGSIVEDIPATSLFDATHCSPGRRALLHAAKVLGDPHLKEASL